MLLNTMNLVFHHHRASVHFNFKQFRNRHDANVKMNSGGVSSGGVAGRDRVIDFGKYKGKMLGSVPSSYLKWVSKNLRAGDNEEWAKLADQVLQDPIYRDRIEWEFAHNLLTGNTNYSSSNSSSSVVVVLEEISSRFGWDNNDKVGWSKVDFELLGTSKGVRIPRLVKDEKKENENEKEDTREETQQQQYSSGGQWGRRMERRQRHQLRSKMMTTTRTQEEAKTQTQIQDHIHNKEQQNQNQNQNKPLLLFPGREAFLRRAARLRRNATNNISF